MQQRGRHQRSPRTMGCAVACLRPEVGGDAAKGARPRPKHNGTHVPTPSEDEHNRITSWVVMLLLLPLTFPLLVHFTDVHNRQTAQHPMTHIDGPGCAPTKQRPSRRGHADRGRRPKKPAIDDKTGRPAASTSPQATPADGDLATVCPRVTAYGHRQPVPNVALNSPSGHRMFQGLVRGPSERGGGSPCVTFRLVVAPLRGPGQSPVLPFACCVGSLRSVGRCGRCSCWCRFRAPPPSPPPGRPTYAQPLPP